jgi:hypothetical protein
MKGRRKVVSGSVVLSLLLLVVSAFAEESAPSSEFTYTDDWAVVSAPPPPGPYTAVNIDPRVPGVDAIPPLPMDAVKTSPEEDIPAEALANPPAAGMPAMVPLQDSPASARNEQQTSQPVMPGRSRHVAPSRSGYYYPAPPRYPAQSHSAAPGGYGYSGYRKQPEYGYYGSPANRQGEQQVPPPPVYDSQMRNQRRYGYPAGPGTP